MTDEKIKELRSTLDALCECRPLDLSREWHSHDCDIAYHQHPGVVDVVSALPAALDEIVSLRAQLAASDAACAALEESVEKMRAERDALRAELNTPHTADFLYAVRIEAAHQRERWGVEHDAGKADSDWFWLVGYLAGKALQPGIDLEKKLHRVIAAAAALLNWHANASGVDTRMRPGIDASLKEQP